MVDQSPNVKIKAKKSQVLKNITNYIQSGITSILAEEEGELSFRGAPDVERFNPVMEELSIRTTAKNIKFILVRQSKTCLQKGTQA